MTMTFGVFAGKGGLDFSLDRAAFSISACGVSGDDNLILDLPGPMDGDFDFFFFGQFVI
jgi:hypothetical protein